MAQERTSGWAGRGGRRTRCGCAARDRRPSGPGGRAAPPGARRCSRRAPRRPRPEPARASAEVVRGVAHLVEQVQPRLAAVVRHRLGVREASEPSAARATGPVDALTCGYWVTSPPNGTCPAACTRAPRGPVGRRGPEEELLHVGGQVGRDQGQRIDGQAGLRLGDERRHRARPAERRAPPLRSQPGAAPTQRSQGRSR